MTSPKSVKGGHTPGPWEVEEAPRRGSWIKGASGEWAALACGDDDVRAAANATLIAAAPTMFAYVAQRAAEGDAEAAAIVEAINASR